MSQYRLLQLCVPLLLAGAGVAAIVTEPAAARAQDPTPIESLHKPLDEILDLYVRDGFVYYRALRQERGRLDRYVASLNVGTDVYERWDRDRRAAFWLNAYNALVLRTVVDHYPIRARLAQFPAMSVRQVPGAFERTAWRVAGRSVTLDDIEKQEVAAFKDPRMYFALGRGAVGGGRLRSEAFSAGRLEAQLGEVAAECVRRVACAKVDQVAGSLSVSPVFSWREADFVAAYGSSGRERYPGRTPIEVAIVGFLEPHLYPSERSWLAENSFRVAFAQFDWRLNDLTGGRPR